MRIVPIAGQALRWVARWAWAVGRGLCLAGGEDTDVVACGSVNRLERISLVIGLRRS